MSRLFTKNVRIRTRFARVATVAVRKSDIVKMYGYGSSSELGLSIGCRVDKDCVTVSIISLLP